MSINITRIFIIISLIIFTNFLLFPLDININGTDIIALHNTIVTFSTANQGDGCIYNWYVDGQLKQSGSLNSFQFTSAPLAETTNTVQVIINIEGNLFSSPVKHVTFAGNDTASFYSLGSGTWSKLAFNQENVQAPGSAAEAFVYNSQLAIRSSSNSLFVYNSSKNYWEDTGIVFPADVKAVYNPQPGLLLTRDSSNILKGYNAPAWGNTNIILPDGTRYLFAGRILLAVPVSGSILNLTDTWNDSNIIVPANTKSIIMLNDIIYAFLGNLSVYHYSIAAKKWIMDGFKLPLNYKDIFVFDGKFTVRK